MVDFMSRSVVLLWMLTWSLVGCDGAKPAGALLPGCSAVNAAMVNAVLGTTYSEPRESRSENVNVCAYLNSLNGGLAATLRFRSSSSHDSLFTERHDLETAGHSINNVAGLGDEAYSSVLFGDPTLYTITARDGALEVSFTSPASEDKEIELVRQLLNRLTG